MKSSVLKSISQSAEDEEFQMAPMIDIVFLLLIYFIMTTTLLKAEADLGIQLPGQVAQGSALKMPDEQIIEVQGDGRVILNGRVFGDPDERGMPELVDTLIRFKQASELAQAPAMVTIQADDTALQQRVIDVMNACAAAKITLVSFGLGG